MALLVYMTAASADEAERIAGDFPNAPEAPSGIQIAAKVSNWRHVPDTERHLKYYYR